MFTGSPRAHDVGEVESGNDRGGRLVCLKMRISAMAGDIFG